MYRWRSGTGDHFRTGLMKLGIRGAQAVCNVTLAASKVTKIVQFIDARPGRVPWGRFSGVAFATRR